MRRIEGTIASALEWPERSLLLFETFLTPVPQEMYYVGLFLRHVFIWVRKRRWLVIQVFFSKTKDLSRSRAVVVSQLRCKVELLLLQSNNRKWCMAMKYRQFRWPWVTFNVIYLLYAFLNVFSFSCAADFNWHSASRGLSAIAELLVLLCCLILLRWV